jgi:hypothetical protein
LARESSLVRNRISEDIDFIDLVLRVTSKFMDPSEAFCSLNYRDEEARFSDRRAAEGRKVEEDGDWKEQRTSGCKSRQDEAWKDR